MVMHREVVYLGRNNTIGLLLNADDEAFDMSSATTVEIVFSGTTISSTTNPGWFDWTSESLTTGQVNIALGSAGATLTAGTYDAELIVYDASNSEGIMWGEIPITIKG
jgi:hypothetical protein